MDHKATMAEIMKADDQMHREGYHGPKEDAPKHELPRGLLVVCDGQGSPEDCPACKDVTLVLWEIWNIAWSRPFTESHGLRIINCIDRSGVDFTGLKEEAEKQDETG